MVDTILDYWFGSPSPPPRHSTLPNKRELWYKGGAAIDTDIRQRFGTHVDNALAGDYDHIAALHSVHGIRGALAVIVLLDQLTRNVFRGSAAAFKGDAKAKGITESIWSSEECQTLPFVWRVSFIMPWMHDESPTSQSRACEELKSMLKQLDAEEKEYKEEEIADCRKMLQMNLSFAEKHGVIIEQFGRFPYRNDVLGRETTEAELVYLKDGDRFGQ